MRDPTAGQDAPAWARALAPLVGAGLALAGAAYFTYTGIDYARRGCGCHEALFPDWIWGVMLAVAVALYAAAAALMATVFAALRQLRRARTR
jgi:hypothetical protein